MSEILRTGWYRADIVGADVEEIGGSWCEVDLCIELKLLDGKHAGGVLRHVFAIATEDAKSLTEGHRLLSSLALAAGLLKLSDAGQLLGAAVIVRVVAEADGIRIADYRKSSFRPPTAPVTTFTPASKQSRPASHGVPA